MKAKTKTNKKPTILIYIRDGAVFDVVSDSTVKVITLDGDIQSDEDVIESPHFGTVQPYHEVVTIDTKIIKETLKLIK